MESFEGDGGGDHVDRVLEQWARERPGLDVAPVAVVARLGRAARYVDHGLAEVFTRHGLRRESWDVLAALRRAGPPYRLTPTDLSRALMRTSGAMTNRLRRLEAVGFIRRIPAEDDGRSLLVELTAEGRALVDRVAGEHLANERRMLSALTPAEQEELAKLLRTLLISFEAERPVPPRPGRRRRG